MYRFYSSILIVVVLFFSGCESHQKYMNYDMQIVSSPAVSKDKRYIAFIAINNIYQRAQGISAFPDGGFSKDLYYNVSLYLYDSVQNKLVKIRSLNEYVAAISLWSSKIVFDQGSICYKFGTVLPSDMKRVRELYGLKAKKITDEIDSFYCYDTTSRLTKTIDEKSFLAVYKKTPLSKEQTDMIKNLPIKNLGIDVQTILQKEGLNFREVLVNRWAEMPIIDAILSEYVFQLGSVEKQEILDELTLHKKKLEKYKTSLDYKERNIYNYYEQYYNYVYKKIYATM